MTERIEIFFGYNVYLNAAIANFNRDLRAAMEINADMDFEPISTIKTQYNDNEYNHYVFQEFRLTPKTQE